MNLSPRLLAAAFGLILPLSMVGSADAVTGHARQGRQSHVTAAADHVTTHHSRHHAHSRRHTQRRSLAPVAAPVAPALGS